MSLSKSLDNEKELLLQISRGDAIAFDTVYYIYHQALYRSIYRLIKDEQIAEDILQDVFVNLWEKRNTISIKETLGGWLFATSFNKSMAYIRNQSNLKPALTEISAVEDDELYRHISEERYELLERAIAQLPTQRQRVFTLCKLQGKSYEEAAAIMNISRHTVKEYLSLAMESVKDFIKKHPDVGELSQFAR